MRNIVLASSNKGKLTELQTLLGNSGFTIKTQSEFAVPDADETGLSFVENAIIKARNACAYANLPSIADDSGIEVDALDGKPGIYSARFAGEPSDDQKNNAALLEALAGVAAPERTARYQCVLVFMRHAEDPTPIICQGSWEGVILEAPQGTGGFGYDPLFYIPSLDCTAAALEKTQKNRISHRGKALQNMVTALHTAYSL